MKSKISKRLLFELYCKIISIIVGIESFVFIFVDIPNDYKWIAALISAAIFIIALIAVLIYANNQNRVVVDLCCANLTVKFGDLFSEDGNKIISCNEYFDSIVDEKLISSKTLHGQVMNKYITDIKDFDKKIIADKGCINSIVGINKNKHDGKQTQYKLGTCFKFDQFIFVAFSKFDSQYQAYLDLPDYLFCLANFWTELNRVYNGENIVVPLMGSGLTRLANNSLSEQQQLQLLIDSLKYSNLSFAYDSHITIVLSKGLKDKIKLFNIE